MFVIYATTPTFFQDVRTYAPDVAELISDGVTMNLQPLTEDDLRALSQRIAFLVERAGITTVTQGEVEELGRKLANKHLRGGRWSVRAFLTDLFQSIPGV